MSTENFTISIQGDSEGYVTFECPYCNSEFKLQAGESLDSIDLHDYKTIVSLSIFNPNENSRYDYAVEQIKTSAAKTPTATTTHSNTVNSNSLIVLVANHPFATISKTIVH